MIKDLLIDYKTTTDKQFNEAEEVIFFVETELASKESNIIVWNDNIEKTTHIQVYSRDCSFIEHEVIFKNPNLASSEEFIEAELSTH